jgi:phenylacetate-CoA ligase
MGLNVAVLANLKKNAPKYPGTLADAWDDLDSDVTVSAITAALEVRSLANRVQPFIRYELGDSVIFDPDPCPCGSPFPAIKVEGRTSEVLTFRKEDGEAVHLGWPPFGEAIWAEHEVSRYQVIQTAPDRLRVRMEVYPERNEEQVWQRVLPDLDVMLAQHGLSHVKVERDPELPQINPVTGKYRRVWREYE